MNYDLLKLSKILPTLQGKRTIDVYQERLEKARQAKKEAEERTVENINFQRTFETPRLSETPKKELRMNDDMRSVDKLLSEKFNLPVENYENLKLLLQGVGTGDDLTAIFKKSSKVRHKRQDEGLAKTTSNNFFKKNYHVEEINSSRPTTMNTQSNFVFKKKKITLRNSKEIDHIYQYTLGRGFSFFDENQLGLNGQKVSMKALSNGVIVNQQKNYLKNLKIDPMTTFNSPYRKTEEFSPASSGKTLTVESPISAKEKTLLHIKNNYKLPNKKTTKKSQQELSNSSTTIKMNTLVLDGTSLKVQYEQDKNSLSPGKSPNFNNSGVNIAV